MVRRWKWHLLVVVNKPLLTFEDTNLTGGGCNSKVNNNNNNRKVPGTSHWSFSWWNQEESLACEPQEVWSDSSSISFACVSFVPFAQHFLLQALICTLLPWWPAWQLRCQEVWLFWGPCTVNHKRFSVGPYFLSLKTLRDHFSYFRDAESHKTHKDPHIIEINQLPKQYKVTN